MTPLAILPLFSEALPAHATRLLHDPSYFPLRSLVLPSLSALLALPAPVPERPVFSSSPLLIPLNISYYGFKCHFENHKNIHF